MIKSLRVDSRLIHGQIVEGWMKAMAVDGVIIIDDFVRESPFEKKILRFALPMDIDLEILSVREASARWIDISASAKTFFLLLQSVKMLSCLNECLAAEGGAKKLPPVNIGLINFTDSKNALTTAVYLDEPERKQLTVLIDEGVEIYTQALPANEQVPLAALLEHFQTSGKGELNE